MDDRAAGHRGGALRVLRRARDQSGHQPLFRATFLATDLTGASHWFQLHVAAPPPPEEDSSLLRWLLSAGWSALMETVRRHSSSGGGGGEDEDDEEVMLNLFHAAYVGQAMHTLGLLLSMLLMTALGLVAAAGLCFVTLAMKWLLLGQQMPGTIPVASHAYVRWWVVSVPTESVASFVLLPLRGTFLIVWWFRALGATIGDNVVIDTADVSDADLLVVGDGTVLQRDAVVRCSRVAPLEGASS